MELNRGEPIITTANHVFGKDTGMMRHSPLLTAVALAIGSAGCTHCDTCDDFPIPCVGGNCGGVMASPAPTGGYTAVPGPVIVTQPSPMPTTAPVMAPPVEEAPAAPNTNAKPIETPPATPSTPEAIPTTPATPPV